MQQNLELASDNATLHGPYRYVWGNVIAIGALHVLCLLAPMTFTWSGLTLAIVLSWITGSLGITLCFHRLLTHRSFETPKWVEYILTIFGCLTWQGGPIHWVGTHRLHHRDSDKPGDPHSPHDGFSWAHMVWCLTTPLDYDPRDAAKDMSRDRVLRAIDNWFWIPQFVLAGVLFGIGSWLYDLHVGLSWFIWGVAVRTVFVYHITWFVNSAAHTWGYRNFKTTDDSRNNWWVALLSFGEGWHNNHHAYQRSAAHGMRWWEIDITYWVIQAMETVGLAWNVVRPQAAMAGGKQPD